MVIFFHSDIHMTSPYCHCWWISICDHKSWIWIPKWKVQGLFSSKKLTPSIWSYNTWIDYIPQKIVTLIISVTSIESIRWKKCLRITSSEPAGCKYRERSLHEQRTCHGLKSGRWSWSPNSDKWRTQASPSYSCQTCMPVIPHRASAVVVVISSRWKCEHWRKIGWRWWSPPEKWGL